MFGLLKAKNPYVQQARHVYALLLEHVRQPVFYRDYAVPDTFEGRFDLLILHVFMVINAVLKAGGDEAFNQALFDVMFADMDQALREAGKGDMGVPKQMRLMMKAFNGRMHVYHEVIEDKKALEAALQRNLYSGAAEAPVAKMRAYIYAAARRLAKQPVDELMNAQISFGITG